MRHELLAEIRIATIQCRSRRRVCALYPVSAATVRSLDNSKRSKEVRVKQSADIVFGLFREEMYESARHIQGATELLVRKNRNGPTGYVDLYFYAHWMRFEDMLDPD